MQNITRTLLLVVLSIASTAAKNETIGYISEFYANFTGGSKLWSGILQECKTGSLACIQKNVYHYLDDTFKYRGDVHFGKYVHFKPNQVDFTKYTKEANEVEDEEEQDERLISPLEEVTRALHNKSVGFLMTHDLNLQLPEMLFEGSTFQVSPRAFEGDGVLVKLELIPKEIQDQPVGRIFFKKIKKFFKNKLVMALMSIVLVISLLKSLLMFIMPLIVGVGTAKKILLKVLLFLFPALTHLFKLCTYYHDSYHGTKYHHHHHQIAHIHHLPSLHHTAPPPDAHFTSSGPPHPYRHEQDEFEFSGPGLGPEYISNRNAFEHVPSKNDENEIKSWGLGHSQEHKGGRRNHKTPAKVTISQIEELTRQAEREAVLKARLQQEQQRIRQENLDLQEQLRQELKLHEQLKLQAMMLAQQKTKLQPQHQMHVTLKNSHPVSSVPNMMPPPAAFPPKALLEPAVYDPFYSPILEKIDKIFNSIGIGEESCRERLVCSMYKNPLKFSPHSNLLSAELSRDPKDLEKPTSSNKAVVRFYRYVQAARDGQDQRDCLRLYQSCNINTEL